MEKLKSKKRRVLVVIDGDSLVPKAHYDLNFLESEKRLDIWLFFSQKIPHSFSLYREYNAKNILLPRYEEDSIPYILKRVCYEIGRRGDKYYKIYFIGGPQSAWEGLVQFFRERGYVAHHMLASDYMVPSSDDATPTPLKDKAPKGVKPTSAPKSPESPQKPPPQSPDKASSKRGKSVSKANQDSIPASAWEKITTEIQKIEPGRRLAKRGFTVLLRRRGLLSGLSKAQVKHVLPNLVQAGLIQWNPETQEVVILPSHG